MVVLPRPVISLAEKQFGVISRRQLLRSMPERQVDWAVERGSLEIVHWGVYRIPGGARPPEQVAMAAVLRVRDARISGPYMLGLYGAENFHPSEDPFVVLAKPGRRPANVDFVVVDDLARGRHDAVVHGGLPSVTPTLACADAALPRFGIPDRRLRVGIDSLRWAGRTSTPRLARLVGEFPRHPGAARLSKMLRSGELVNESEGERLVDALVDQVTPRPQRQVAVIPGRRADFVWPTLWTILEYDGAVHDSPERRQQDGVRDDDLSTAGYEVLHANKHDVSDPDQFVTWLVATLQRRARELGVPVHVARTA